MLNLLGVLKTKTKQQKGSVKKMNVKMVNAVVEGRVVVRNPEFDRFELREYRRHKQFGLCFKLIDACYVSEISNVSGEVLERRFPSAEAIMFNCFPVK